MNTDGKLSKLVHFYGQKIDVHSEVDSDYNRGCRLAYSIAKYMTEQIVFELLDKELQQSLKVEDEDEYV